MLDFIERYFGVSPDNGDGSIESLSVVALIILLVVFVLRVGIAKRPGK